MPFLPPRALRDGDEAVALVEREVRAGMFWFLRGLGGGVSVMVNVGVHRSLFYLFIYLFGESFVCHT